MASGWSKRQGAYLAQSYTDRSSSQETPAAPRRLINNTATKVRGAVMAAAVEEEAIV